MTKRYQSGNRKTKIKEQTTQRPFLSTFVFLNIFLWLLYCLIFDLHLPITPLVSFDHCIVCSLIYILRLPLWYLLVIVLSVLWFKSSDYHFGIFWSLCCLFFVLCLLVTPLVFFGHCIVCSLTYVFWWPFGIFWSLYCLFFDLRLLITPLVSVGYCIVCSLIYVFWLPLWHLLVIVLSVLWFTLTKRYRRGNQKT
jgi:hypothetical protein